MELLQPKFELMQFNKDSTPVDKAFIEEMYAKMKSKEKFYFRLIELYLLVMVAFMVQMVISKNHETVGIALSVFLFLFIPLSMRWISYGISKNDYKYVEGYQEITIVEKIDLSKPEIKRYFEAIDRLGRTITRGEYKAILEYQEEHYGDERRKNAHDIIYKSHQ